MIRPGGRAALLAALVWCASPVDAQDRPLPPRTPHEALVSTYNADFLRDLPTSDNLFSVVENMEPSVVPDRFSADGLSVGQPARLGGFLSSWTQTLFRVDGVPFTDPTGSGFPLLIPGVGLFSTIRIGTGGFSAANNAPGLSLDLQPTPPAARWVSTFEGSFSHGSLTASGAGAAAPPLARLDGFDRVAVTASGPLSGERLGATFSVSGTRGTERSRGESTSARSNGVSAFAHLVATPDAANGIRAVIWGEHRERPLDVRTILNQATATSTNTAGRAQLVWDHRPEGRAPWHVSAGVTVVEESPDYGDATSGIADRLVSGPVGRFASLATRETRAWSLETRISPDRMVSGRRHAFATGLAIEGGQLTSTGFFSGTIGELVGESPARVWRFTNPGLSSTRHNVSIAAYADDHVAWTDRLNLDVGLRLESVSGSAEGAANGIGWRSVFPRAAAEWVLNDRFGLTASAAYSRSGIRLALDDLAIGDPAAPTADVFRWNALAGQALSLADRGALVARAGPGTGGNPAFASIDPDLKRPTSDEFVLSFEAAPSKGVLFRLAGVARSERNLAGVTNPGVPTTSSYTAFSVQDPGGNLLDPADDQKLTVYNRIPSSFGRDRYLLTTPGHSGSTFKGLELSLQLDAKYLTLATGATAGLSETFANAVGFGPMENDQTVAGDLFSNPNAGTLPHGRPFADRAFTAKVISVVRFPRKVRLGLVARYQDGQPFSRVLVFPGLTQGAEPIRAFSNGESRFMFIGTLDARLQKTFAIGGHTLDGFLDIYNLPNRANSVEEDIDAGPDVRIPTAVQPPRSVHVGFRLAF